MKVLLTIWISAVLIQEVIPSTLVRLPEEADKNRSVVQTEYVAKYEQKGKHGNESCGRVFGKHEIVHETCGDNWNSFADKCASLIKDLVSSLANTVSSKPGDATNLQVQIKNTFKHFDNTHNCTCTGKLSEIDLSPIFKNTSPSPEVSPDKQNECEINGKNCGKGDSKRNDEKKREGSDSGSKNNDQPSSPSCTGDKSCSSGPGPKKPNEEQKQPNLQVAEDDNSQVNPEADENSNDEITKNSRRQITHPKFSTMKPPTSGTTADSSSQSPDSKHSDSEETSISPTTSSLKEQTKSPFVGPNSSSQSGKSNQSDSPKAQDPPITSSSNSKIPPSSDSQLLDPQNKDSASQTVKYHESSSNPHVNSRRMTTEIPQKENEKRSSLGFDNEDQKHTTSTIPFSPYHQPTIMTPMTPKPTGSSSRSSGDYNKLSSSTPSFPSQYEPLVRVPISNKKTSNDSGSPGYHILRKMPHEFESDSATGHAAEGNERPKHSSSFSPTSSHSKTTEPDATEHSVGSNSDFDSVDQESFSSIKPAQPGTTIQPKENANEYHKSSFSTTPVFQSSEFSAPKRPIESTEKQRHSSSTTPAQTQFKSAEPGMTRQTTASSSFSYDEGQKYSYSTTPTPFQSKTAELGTNKTPTRSDDVSADVNQEYSSSTASAQFKSTESGIHKNPSESIGDLSDEQSFSSTKSITPGLTNYPSQSNDGDYKPYYSTSSAPIQSKSTKPGTIKQSAGNSSGSDDQHQKYSFTTLAPNQSNAAETGTTKHPTGSNSGSDDQHQKYSFTTLAPNQSNAVETGTTKHTTGSNSVLGNEDPESSSSTKFTQPETTRKPSDSADEDLKKSSLTAPPLSLSKSSESGTTKQPNENTDRYHKPSSSANLATHPFESDSTTGHAAEGNERPKHSSSFSPTSSHSKTTEPDATEHSVGSNSDFGSVDQESFSSIKPAQPGTTIQPKENANEYHKSSFSTTPVFQSSEFSAPKRPIERTEKQRHSSSTTPAQTQFKSAEPGMTRQTTASSSFSDDEGQKYSYSTTPLPIQSKTERGTTKKLLENTDENHKHSSSTTPVPSPSKYTVWETIKPPTESATSLGVGDQKHSSSSLLDPFNNAAGSSTLSVNNEEHKPSSSTSAAPAYCGKLNLDTSEKSKKHSSDPHSQCQQERPITYAPTLPSSEGFGGETHSTKPASPDSGSPEPIGPKKSEHHFTIAPEVPGPAPKPSQPGALIPGSHFESEDQDSGYMHPTTFQTTSVEPTVETSSGYLPLTENVKPIPTSLPTATYKPMPIKPSTSPKTTETQEDDEDDEEDCCSCESCTEEEIIDPKIFKENACKNLEEARKELKAIFNKIKKKLKCGRKSSQPITTPPSKPLF